MAKFNDRLKELRSNSGFSQRDFAAQIGLSKSSINMYERGEREPSLETLEAIADFYNVDIDYLMGKSDIKNKYMYNYKQHSPTIAQETITFPIIGDIAAGFDKIAVESWEGETVEIPLSYLKGHSKDDFFVLSVKGDSMYPFYLEGDKVLLLKQSTVDNGEVGAVIYNDECATLKKVEFIAKNLIKLIPLNPLYKPEEIKDEDVAHLRIIGVPRLLIREIENS